ncbi:MAG: hypothetical protein M3N93_00245 [Acidobacteriota bacterium]|nr:hypothetical protein [Acidobacteriota bacterium]
MEHAARDETIAAESARVNSRAGSEVFFTGVFFKSSALNWTLLSLLLFVVVEAAVFRTGWYIPYLEPQSSAGSVESYLHWLAKPDRVRVPEVMVLGDSRMAEGFSAPLADEAVRGRLHFWNFGIAGSTPRIWYYLLRDTDRTRRRFAAIAIAMDGYADEDRWDHQADRLIDLNFVVERLRWTDCVDFARSMTSFDHKMQAFSGCLFKGIPLRSDVQEFLLNRRDRIRRSADWRNNGLGYLSDYGGRPQNLAGLSADFTHHTIEYPRGISPATKETIDNMVMRPPEEQRGEMTRYRALWLNRIMDLYKDSPTRIVYFELARAPVPKPESSRPATFLQTALQRPGVVALPRDTFRDLERPEIFFDGLHFNKTGRGLFSNRLAAKISPLLGIQ